MKTVDPNESLGFHCSITFRAFTAALEKHLKDTGVTSAQFLALSHLKALGPMPQNELAAHLATSSVSVVKLIDRLERDNWVSRTPHPDDRRINNVALTQKALGVWQELTAHAREVIDTAHQGLSENEIQTVKDLLRKVRDNLNKL